MTDRIAKSLDRLNGKEKRSVKSVLVLIKRGDLASLDVKKLRGHKDIFRVRKGNIRIIYRDTGSGIFILAIERRSEKAYRGF